MVYDKAWFLNRIAEKRPGYEEFELVSDYVNAHTKVRFLHKVCGEEFDITPNSFMNGRGCMTCGRKSARDKNRKSLEEIYQMIPKSLTIMDEFVSVLYKNKFKCSDCGTEFESRVHDLARTDVCSYCRGTNRETTETFSNYLMDDTDGDYSLIGEYTSANAYVTLRHNVCGNEYQVTPHNFKHGKRCAKCISSVGEKLVRESLTDMNVKFEEQKKFDDLIRERHLSYDFFIPAKNALIEYQGQQHYVARDFFGGDKAFEIQQQRDTKKRQYAKNNGYTLIEIPYTINSVASVTEYLRDKV